MIQKQGNNKDDGDRAIPTGWGSKVTPIYDELSGKIINVERGTTSEDAKAAASYIGFLDSLFKQ